jgi:hypothetical protein
MIFKHFLPKVKGFHLPYIQLCIIFYPEIEYLRLFLVL